MQIRKMFSACSLFFIMYAVLSAEEIVIDPVRAVICAQQADDFAVQELKTHLELITGKTIPVLKDGEPEEKAFVFHVGKTPDGETAKFQPEEARWKITPGAAYFYGDGAKGPQNAVYDFLENELGVRWPGGSDIAFRKQDPIHVKKEEGKWIPELNMRIIRNVGGNKESSLWRTRMRTGSHDRPQYGHAFTQYWKRFGKTHPEYFAMRGDGVRAPAGMNADSDNAAAAQGEQGEMIAMCVTSEGLIRQIIEDWKGKGCPLYINLCENDALGKDSCHCPGCTALDVIPERKNDQWQNWYADRYVHFANRVLAEAKKIRPDVKAAMYGYNATEQAPSREKPDPELVIGIVPTDFTMESIRSYVGSWKKAGLNHFFYRPNRHVYYRLTYLPTGFERHFFDLWQYLYQSGAIGFDYDAPAEESIFQYYSDYFLMKAMQDPSKPFEYWEKHYMESFGAAAEDVSMYFRYWREQVWEARVAPHQAELAEQGKWFNFGRGLLWNLEKYYRESDFIEAEKFLETALTRELTQEDRTRLETLKLAHDHARLFFRAVAFKTDQDALALLDFRKRHNLNPLPHLEQYYGDICGIKRVMNFKEYTPPYLKTPLFWNFRLDPENRGISERWYENSPEQVRNWGAVMCTNTPWESPHESYREISDSIREQTARYDGLAWYGTQIRIPANWRDRKIYLYFGAVDESCRLYLNGREAGSRIHKNPNDWSTPFALEITSYIDWDKEMQQVIVRVEDTQGQGGIWKPVWLLSK